MNKQYNFTERQEHYCTLDANLLFYALQDARKAIQAFKGTDLEGYYFDDAGTIQMEITRRREFRFYQIATKTQR